jgi:hypothetical protein
MSPSLATDPVARAFALWKQSFGVGGGGIASSSAKRRIQKIALEATLGAVAADPSAGERVVGFVCQLLRRGTILRGGDSAALLDAIARAPSLSPATSLALAAALRSYDDALADRAVERVLAQSPPADHDALRARIAVMAQPIDEIPDPSQSEKPVTAWRCKVVPSRSPTGEPITKLGGLPWLPASTPWPVCGACGQPMRFAAQLARGEAVPLRRYDLVSVFFCDGCLLGDDHDAATQVLLMPGSGAASDRAPASPLMREYRLETRSFKDEPDEDAAADASFATKLGGFPRWQAAGGPCAGTAGRSWCASPRSRPRSTTCWCPATPRCGSSACARPSARRRRAPRSGSRRSGYAVGAVLSRLPGQTTGTMTVKVEPCPTWLSTTTSPWRSDTTRRTRARPRPTPP